MKSDDAARKDAGNENQESCSSSKRAQRERKESQNPSPPPELLEAGDALAGDAIGETLFSERWVLRTLMKLTEVVSQVVKDDPNADDDDSEAPQELDKEIELLLSQLWDMSADKDVVVFLLSLPTLDVIADAMTFTKMPRLTEIVAGILGNMACVDEALAKITEHSRLVSVTLQLLDMSDPPTLTEAFRFLLTCIRSKSHMVTWLKIIQEDKNFLPHLTFIMASSTNVRLLTMAADFVDVVLDASDDLCNNWSTFEFVDSLLEALRQLGIRASVATETYLHILQLLSTSSNGKAVLFSHRQVVIDVVSTYLRSICEDDCIIVVGHEAGLASALLLIHILLLRSFDDVVKQMDEELTMMSIVKLTRALNKSNSTQSSGDQSEQDRDQHETQILRDILEDAVVTLLEELLYDNKGTRFLLKTLENSGTEGCQNLLVWLKTLPSGQWCHGQLTVAISANRSDVFKNLNCAIAKEMQNEESNNE